MSRHSALITFTFLLLAGLVSAAVPNDAALKNNTGDSMQSRPQALVFAQATTGLQGNELQLLNQIQADTAQLKADEAAEKAGTRHVNPQIRYIRWSLLRLAEAAWNLKQTSEHYHGNRGQALQGMAEAHNALMQCYRIDSQQ
jgi:hypothetical protein